MSASQDRIEVAPSKPVVQEQSEIFVSSDEDGDVVIRQYRWDEGDVSIFVCPQNVPALVRAILNAAGLDPDVINPKDATASERQRRHRKKLRDSHANDSVTVTAGSPAMSSKASLERGLTAS